MTTPWPCPCFFVMRALPLEIHAVRSAIGPWGCRSPGLSDHSRCGISMRRAQSQRRMARITGQAVTLSRPGARALGHPLDQNDPSAGRKRTSQNLHGCVRRRAWNRLRGHGGRELRTKVGAIRDNVIPTRERATSANPGSKLNRPLVENELPKISTVAFGDVRGTAFADTAEGNADVGWGRSGITLSRPAGALSDRGPSDHLDSPVEVP